MRIGIDTGGTFTDFVGMDEDGRIVVTKSSTTPKELTQGILKCFQKLGFQDLETVSQVLHGCTIAINTIIQQAGAKTALITTRGMRDIYEIGRENRPDTFNLFFHRPRPLVSRRWRLEVKERISAKGDVLAPLDESELVEIVALLKREAVEAVGVCFLHSYANPVHERKVGEILRRELPGVYLTLSHELIREIGEYERTSTTVLNSYIGPVMANYLDRLDKHLRALRFRGNLLIMQSNGGCMSVEVARKQPTHATESGPVSGVIAAGHLSRILGLREAIAFDMGGTTAKTAFLKNSVLPLAPGVHIGGYDTGQPMMLPVVDIVEVGTGGGSIASLDELGVLRVGPKSAGADPGPVCYGQGGTEPTVTDANLVLGRLNPKNFLGGEMPLDESLARSALEERIAAPKGMAVEVAADAVLQISVNAMSLAVRRISVEKGVDPRDCVLIVFGGAGPLHAAGVAKELLIPKVLVPPMPGMFCALGMLVADLRHNYVQTYLRKLRSADMAEVVRLFAEMQNDAQATLASEGAYPDSLSFVSSLDLRYQGQHHVLSVPVSAQELHAGSYDPITTRYDRLHHEYYHQSAPGEVVEVVNLRLEARGQSYRGETRVFPPIAEASRPPRKDLRRVYWGSKLGWLETPIYAREEFAAGLRLEGPAVIEEWASTTIVHPGDRLVVDRLGNLVVEVA